jgi:hypothetical protein
MPVVGIGLPVKSPASPMLILVLTEGHLLEDEMLKNFRVLVYEL